MRKPRVLLTGATGFTGQNILDAFAPHAEIYALGRRSHLDCVGVRDRTARWYQVDISDRAALERTFEDIRRRGGVDIVLHFAAFYDFTGKEYPEYQSTNVDGLRNVLDLSAKHFDLALFVFASSLAACRFPGEGQALDESSPADSDHPYARSKKAGEQMLSEYADAFKSVIVRMAAIYSDWCEYPPLYSLLGNWLSDRWTRRFVAGKGCTGIPYLHVRDLTQFLRRVVERMPYLDNGQVLIASPDGVTTHVDLFNAMSAYRGAEIEPRFVPRAFVAHGIRLRRFLGRFSGEIPFERTWMARYVDMQLRVDGARTRALLNWQPRARFDAVRRLPFLIENVVSYPLRWRLRNEAILKRPRIRPGLKIANLLQDHRDDIANALTASLISQGRFRSYRKLTPKDHLWNHRMIVRHLTNSIRARNRHLFVSYCHDLAERRFEEGFAVDELLGAVELVGRTCIDVLSQSPDASDVVKYLPERISMTIRFGLDQIEEVYEDLHAGAPRRSLSRGLMRAAGL